MSKKFVPETRRYHVCDSMDNKVVIGHPEMECLVGIHSHSFVRVAKEGLSDRIGTGKCPAKMGVIRTERGPKKPSKHLRLATR